MATSAESFTRSMMQRWSMALTFTSASVIKWMVVGVILTNSFVITLGLLWLHHAKSQDMDDAVVITNNLVRVLEEYITGSIRCIDLSLLSIQDEAERQMASNGSIDEQSMNLFISRQKIRTPDVLSLRIADASGLVQYGSGVLRAANVNISDRKYFTLQRDSEKAGLVIDDPVLTRINHVWAVPISRRINHRDGSFAGVAYANVAVETLSHIISIIDSGKQGVVAIYSKDYGLIVRYPEPKSIGEEIGNKTASSQFLALIKSGKTTGTYTAYTAIDHIERIFSYR